MKSLSRKKNKNISQEQVTEFYDKLIFPSSTSPKAYEELFINRFKELKCNAIFLDISWNAINKIDYGHKINASLTDLPLENSSIDIVFCIGVVHHIPRMEKAISELLRITKTGGKLYLGVYSEKSLQALLRKLYDLSENLIMQRTIYFIASCLIWIKNRKNQLKFRSITHYKRVDDLLKTPLVRYWPLRNYARILSKLQIKYFTVQKISCMNVLIINK